MVVVKTVHDRRLLEQCIIYFSVHWWEVIIKKLFVAMLAVFVVLRPRNVKIVLTPLLLSPVTRSVIFGRPPIGGSSHQMALPVNGITHLIPAYYSFYRPWKDERLSWPSWLTYSGWFAHISGHPSAAGRAQDRESSPARDRRSTTVPRHQHGSLVCDKSVSPGVKAKILSDHFDVAVVDFCEDLVFRIC